MADDRNDAAAARSGVRSGARTGPLAGIRVLDLTQFLAGPFGTQILGDLGAEVIKLESPAGDWSRTLPPHFVGDDSCYFLSINRNKESVVIDIKQPRGLELVKGLADRCDILMENFRPGVMQRLGLTYDDLAARNPGLVWCSISGFGQDGPYRDRPAYDMIVQAISGGMSLTGERGGAAVRAGVPIGDLAAGMYGVIGVMAALEERHRTGRGRMVDISMLDCQASLLTYQAAYYLHSGQVPDRQGSGHDSIPTYRAFACKGGTELVITANTEKMWQGLCDVLELGHLKDHALFADNETRFANRVALWPILEKAFLAAEAKQWVPLLQQAGVPVGEVNDLHDALGDAQLNHRHMVVDLTAEDGRSTRVVGNPIRFSGAVEDGHSYPPALGADTSGVLATVLGLSEAEIEACLKDDTIRILNRG
jgi:crotonobetainyl-CoA:carnitine CoA-transferase CaiB-like acyl-CoA transferase